MLFDHGARVERQRFASGAVLHAIDVRRGVAVNDEFRQVDGARNNRRLRHAAHIVAVAVVAETKGARSSVHECVERVCLRGAAGVAALAVALAVEKL
ncbi:hypothetical protein [Ralstonia pseudosolanacearum]|uniref:hypothetical protein n=1 Tax=Ralstonia pseudosolanacearum TaxID=1310165 RepID=UPI003CEB20BE